MSKKASSGARPLRRRVKPEPVLTPIVENFDELTSGTVSALKRALATGDLDDKLDELLSAEEDAGNRSTAVTAILSRSEVVG